QYEADMAAFEKRIDAIIAAAKNRAGGITFTPSEGLIWPLQYKGTYISSGYGTRTDPGTGRQKYHGGIDTCVSGGTYGKSVVAAANGTVLTASYMANGYGYYVLIDHGNGLYTLYGHNSRLNVSTGQTVKQGDVIAYAGESGYAFGAHVHFEVRVNGNKVNPLSYAHLP
ncbi:MAG: M23 family metallopeptidase, partial [Oscillospiraceae bacterium]|nr:M23 family metallopeptidase [Oscillospiraceae bacterium]